MNAYPVSFEKLAKYTKKTIFQEKKIIIINTMYSEISWQKCFPLQYSLVSKQRPLQSLACSFLLPSIGSLS